MSKSLYIRLAAIFVSIALISVIIISLISNVSTGIAFKKYISDRQEREKEVILSMLQNAYEQGIFNQTVLDEMAMYAMMDNLNIKIKNNKDQIVWNAYYNEHRKIMADITDGKGFNSFAKSYVENQYMIVKDNIKIGTLIIGFDGEYSMSYRDIDFMNSFNKWLIISGFVSVLIALLLSFLVSKKITDPIVKATEVAHSIKEGNLEKRLDVETETMEIAEFADTINHLAESLESQEKLRSQLTSDVAHELRTPLATLQSHTEALLDGVWEPTKDRIESIHEEIVRISKLVNDIEKLTEIENEAVKLDNSNFDIVELIEIIAKNFEAQAQSKGVEIIVENTEQTEIFADRDKMSQVIVNLLSNALKYTPSGGKIILGIKRSDKNTQIMVKDSGAGIDKKHLPYIFERFYRVDSSRTRATGGAGIGLTITKSIVKAHGGEIKVSSEEGVGTEFIISIPNI